MRLSLWLIPCLLAFALAAGAAGAAGAARAMHPLSSPALVRALRTSADHYRSVTWLYQRAARQRVTPTSFSYRRSKDPHYLEWTVTAWQRHEYLARQAVLRRLTGRLDLELPRGPGVHASLYRRVSYAKSLALRLQRNVPSGARSLAAVRQARGREQLFTWQRRAAVLALQVVHHARALLAGPSWLTHAFTCIHHYEGAWTAHTGNGYYGGLQMDTGFMRRYGGDFYRHWGTADRWPAWAQLEASVRAYRSGRGFYPWPNTARACGLL